MMDDAIVIHHGTLLHWHGDTIEAVADTGGALVIRLGSEVLCGVGRTTQRKQMSTPKNFKNTRGTIAVIYTETREDDVVPAVIELGVQLQRGGLAWFTPSELELVVEIQEASHAC